MKNTMIYAEYIYDFAVDGGSTAAAIDLSAKAGKSTLPLGAVVHHFFAKVLTAPTAADTSATLAFGNTTSATAYGAAANLDSWALGAVNNSQQLKGALMWDDSNDCVKDFHVDSANDANVLMTIGTKDITAGKVLCGFHYFNPSL